jgi:hypothetical protein
VAQSHTSQDCCVRFAVVVTFHAATLTTERALPLTRAGLSPARSRQLDLAHNHQPQGRVAAGSSDTRTWISFDPCSAGFIQVGRRAGGTAPAEAGAEVGQCRVLPVRGWIIWWKWAMAAVSSSKGIAVISS